MDIHEYSILVSLPRAQFYNDGLKLKLKEVSIITPVYDDDTKAVHLVLKHSPAIVSRSSGCNKLL